MNTTQIKGYLSRIPVDSLVCGSDRLPTSRPPPPPTAIVANTVPHTERGEHWVAFYVDKRSGVIEYFDSYGRPPYQADFQKFLRRHSSRYRYVYNRTRLQGFDTSVCAHYCLTYLYCRAVLGATMGDYVQLFNPAAPPRVNDAQVLGLFNSFFHQR